MEDNCRVEFRFYVGKIYKPVAFYPIRNNGCCDKTFFILTSNETNHGTNYSCQCGCGGWCTTGCKTEAEAVREYRKMCDRYEKEESERR